MWSGGAFLDRRTGGTGGGEGEIKNKKLKINAGRGRRGNKKGDAEAPPRKTNSFVLGYFGGRVARRKNTRKRAPARKRLTEKLSRMP